jgi:WD40 repeat protein/energy-coupling factor transporter ATP-binding protein EcfA2
MAPVITKDEELNPFPGLRPFTSGESEYFFGRETESEEITGKITRNRFLAIIGASGSGKSSLIQCGLVPRIRDLSLNGPPVWLIINMKPGNDPFGSLADAFAENLLNADKQGISRGEILRILKESPNGIDELIKKHSSKTNRKILLIIDQFEELFRYGSPETGKGTGAETAGFINLLTQEVIRGSQDFYLAVAVRSDLLTECAHYRGFTNLLNNSNYFVSGMQKESVRKAIESPLKNTGVKIDPELVDLLISEISERNDQLPVLQHALMRIWTRWKELGEKERPIGFSDFNAIGTVKDSISRHANEVYENLGQEGKEICERLFKTITGKGSDNKGIRYPSNIRTIKSVIGCSSQDLIQVIEKFRDPSMSFLISFPDQLADDSIIDLSHESLIHLWDRLKNWVDEESASVQMYLDLSEASALYQQGKTGLLGQPELQNALKWREQNKPTLWWAQKYNPAFERAMVYLRTSEKKYLENEERKARLHKWRLKRIRVISSILGGIALLTALSMVVAFVSKFNADSRRKTAEKQKNEIIAQKAAVEQYATVVVKKSIEADSNAIAAARREQQERLLREDAETRFRLAAKDVLEARRQTDSAKQSSLDAEMNAITAVEQKDEAQRLRMISVAKSMSLRSIQTKGQKDLQGLLAYQAYLFNKKSKGFSNDADIYMGLYNLAKQYGNDNYSTFTGHDGDIKSIAFIPGKKEFFTSGSDGKVLKWDIDNKVQSFQVVYSNTEVIDVLAVSPKADWLACGTGTAAIKMIPLSGNTQGYELKGHNGKIKSLVFSYDGNYLYSAALDGKVLKWDLMARTSINLATDMLQITSIDLSTNGRYIAGVSDQGKALVWNQDQTSDKFRIESPGKTIRSIRFKPDDERIAVGYDDGVVELWDIASKTRISEIKAHAGEVNDIRFNNKYLQMATSGSDGTLKLWDMADLTNLPVSFDDNGGPVFAFGFSPDGEMILSAGVENKPVIIRRPTLADTFAADGCSYVTRNFTPDEWLAYVGKDISYEKTCPGVDLKIRIREIR